VLDVYVESAAPSRSGAPWLVLDALLVLTAVGLFIMAVVTDSVALGLGAAALVLVSVVAVYGITRIEINDNPVKWFAKSHPIRQADEALNAHFGGTYMAYLVLEARDSAVADQEPVDLARRIEAKAQASMERYPKLPAVVAELTKLLTSPEFREMDADETAAALKQAAEERMDAVPEGEDDLFYAWDEMVAYLDTLGAERAQAAEPFKDFATLRYVQQMQSVLEGHGDLGTPAEAPVVGKSNSLANVVMKVHQELTDGSPENYRIPDDRGSSRTP
jgi:hypothetical protein